jgi:hypothetical protein
MSPLSKLGLTLLVLNAPLVCSGGIGDIDLTYGQGGQFTADFGFMAALDDGHLLYATSDGYARTDTEGQSDSVFGQNGVTAWPTGFVPAAAASLRVDGGLLVGGAQSTGYYQSAALVMLASNGLPDGRGVTVFGPVDPSGGWGARVEAIARQSDGKLLVLFAEYDNPYYEATGVYLRRLLPDLTPDSTFGTEGVVSLGAFGFEGGGRLYVLLDGSIEVVWSENDAVYVDSHGVPQSQPTGGDRWIVVGTHPNGGQVLISDETHFPYSDTLRISLRNVNGISERVFESSLTNHGLIQQATLSADGSYLYIVHPVTPGENYMTQVRRFIVGGANVGQFDATFGNQGTVTLLPDKTLREVMPVSNGAALVLTYPATALRLLGAPTPSPGVIGMSIYQITENYESSGELRIRVSRTLGGDGAASVAYETVTRSGEFVPATPDEDYVVARGRLEWADGDSMDKTVTIQLKSDDRRETTEHFAFVLSDVSGARLDTDLLVLGILNGSAATANSGGSGSGSEAGSGPGGGGSFEIATISVLGVALALRRTRVTRRRQERRRTCQVN